MESVILPGDRDSSDNPFCAGATNDGEGPPSSQRNPGARIVVCFHDESICHANESAKVRSWKKTGKTGKLKDKDEGDAVMIAGYICNEVGILRDSVRTITPGKAPGKDPYWNGAATLKQAEDHLNEMMLLFPGFRVVDIYDNSTGHDCEAPDALHVRKMNKNPGKKVTGGLYKICS